MTHVVGNKQFAVFISKLLKLPAVKGMEGKILLRELYEQCYGIADHMKSSNPMEICLQQPLEDIKNHTQDQELADQFAALGIYTTFGVSYTEFKNMSISESSRILHSANKMKEQESKVAKKINDKL